MPSFVHNPSVEPLTILCLASFDKGHDFMREAKRQGCRVFLLTSLSLQHTVNWPRESLEDIFYMPDGGMPDQNEAGQNGAWNLQDMVLAVSHLCRTQKIDRIVPLDDLDVEKASMLREHLRIPGMGETATRYFRDKLAMRMRAQQNDIPVPEFTATFNFEQIARFVQDVSPPWVLKPRLLAGAIGIKKFYKEEELWNRIHSVGDGQSFLVLERFVPGDIFHVDSIWFGGAMVFAVSSAYGTPPLEVSQGGGIFTTRTLQRDSADDRALLSLNETVLKAFEMRDGVSHTEFIRAHEDGKYYFLETSARVGGAHIADLIEAATGINMWAEWAKLEVASARGSSYTPPVPSTGYAGLLVSLTRQEFPDTSRFPEPELVWRMNTRYHIGFIVKSEDYGRVERLLDLYAERVRSEFHASAPARETVGE